MKTDEQLKADITEELQWDPAVDAARVGVAVHQGVVTLTGTLDTHARKQAVERAVRRVSGVRAIALDLEVELAPGHRRGDPELAQAVLHALRWNALVPADRIRVEVEDGHVTLTGQVDWSYQRAGAEQCLAALVGLRRLTNDITVRPHASAQGLAAQIAAAFARHASREARHIGIEVEGGVVTLRGAVGSMAERDAAVGTASAARGVSRVVDLLDVTG